MFEDRYQQQTCQKCDAADAVCAAYRHALKDVVRGKAEDAIRVAVAALDNDRQYMLGRTFHKIVKAGMILSKHMADQGSVDFTRAALDLAEAVQEITKDPGSTVRGWMGEK